jgi:prepilin-type processing-associated H-X9-DG protein
MSERYGKPARRDEQDTPLARIMMEDAQFRQRPVPLCPEASELSTRVLNRGGYNILFGTADTAWGISIGDPAVTTLPWPWPGGCSYGTNGWAFSDESVTDPATRERKITTGTKQPETVPVAADAMYEWSTPEEADLPGRNLTAPDLMEPARSVHPFGMMVFCMVRHGRAVNVVFLDGHAATTPLEDLWRLKWHNQWVPRDVKLPAK